MNTYHTEEICVKGTVNLRQLREFHMMESMNEHMVFTLRGNVSAEEAEEYEKRKLLGEAIHIYCYSGAEEVLLGCGILTEVEIYAEGDIFGITMKGASASWLMSRERKKRSFQNPDWTYDDLLKKISGKNKKIIYQLEKKTRIEAPIIQYEETDWELLNRLANRLQTVLVPDVLSEKSTVHFGPRQRKAFYLKEQDKLQFAFSNRSGSKISCIVKVKDNMLLGDTVIIKEQKWIIAKKQVIYNRNHIEFEYTLGRLKDYIPLRTYNNTLSGVAICGKVIKSKDEYLKLWLDIDTEQQEKDAYWYPYLPETGNVMYTMPEEGAAVVLYFSNEKAGDGMVIHCLHQKKNRDKKRDPRVKALKTPADKKIEFFPNRIEFTGGKRKGENQIDVGEAAGVLLTSRKRVRIMADEGVSIKSGLSCTTTAINWISVSQTGQENRIEMWGNQIVCHARKYQTASVMRTSKNLSSQRENKRDYESFSSMYTSFTGMIAQGDCGTLNDKILGGIPEVSNVKKDIQISSQEGLRSKKTN